MPNIEFFSQFGIYFERNFLNEHVRLKIRDSLLQNDEFSKGRIVSDDGQKVTDEEWRKVLRGTVCSEIQHDVRQELTVLQPRLEAHFQTTLHGFETPQFLLYQVGDFYRHHRDVVSSKGGAHSAKNRKVSIVLFVNGEGNHQETDFQGGALTFYGLVKGKSQKDFGLPVVAEAGLLVAFPSTIFHEVFPVTSGKRVSIVTFYFT